MEHRSRFAPSPTGLLHIGNARSAALNWAYIKNKGGQFILRIDDTDKERSKKEFEIKIKKDLKWITIKYGQVLIFNQCLPHGNVVNKETETRWSLNCRFKGVFSPYKDKKLGEFFEPISLRKISQLAINYKLPKIK